MPYFECIFDVETKSNLISFKRLEIELGTNENLSVGIGVAVEEFSCCIFFLYFQNYSKVQIRFKVAIGKPPASFKLIDKNRKNSPPNHML